MANPTTVFDTTLGSFKVEIYTDQMPITGGNFVKLAKDGFYDGLHFHRVIDGFMIQFGCPHSKGPNSSRCGTGGPPHGTIQDEHNANFKESNLPGTLSMARSSDPNSAGSQFFICLTRDKCQHLDGKYTGFGQVIDGMDVVTKLGAVATDQHDCPNEPLALNGVKSIE